jgi:hypothetical protein
MENTLAKILKNMKVYEIVGKVDGWPLFVEYCETRAEAQKVLKEKRNADGRPTFRGEIKEVNLYEIVQEERENAALENRLEIYQELRKEYDEKYDAEYKKEIAKEKKRLQKEMRKLLKNWCDIEMDEN